MFFCSSSKTTKYKTTTLHNIAQQASQCFPSVQSIKIFSTAPSEWKHFPSQHRRRRVFVWRRFHMQQFFPRSASYIWAPRSNLFAVPILHHGIEINNKARHSSTFLVVKAQTHVPPGILCRLLVCSANMCCAENGGGTEISLA